MLVEVLLLAGNVLLWILLSLWLKKKLSPEGVMKDARKELEGLLLQINSASDRNIRLIQNQIEQAKSASSEVQMLCNKVEERIALLYGEMDKLSSVKAAEELLYSSSRSDEGGAHGQEAGLADGAPVPVEAPARSEPTVSEPKKEASAELPPYDTLNKSYSPLGSYMKEQLRFADAVKAAPPEPSRKVEIPEFIKPEKPIEIKKSFRQQVLEMRALGYSVDEIAHKTGRSVQEVKITIEIS
ncbi:MAG: hypothetical protein ILP18_09940 [Treponema sp.]|nr:hypothetical protein [Treponema sp.]